MWECKKCGEENEDTFDLCWKCSTLSGVKRNIKSEYPEESAKYDGDAKRFDDENLMVSDASSIIAGCSMAFSLRSLLALISVVALGFSTWRSVKIAQHEKNRLTTILSEIESAKSELNKTEVQNAWLHLDKPMLQQAIQDEFAAIQSLREQSEAHLQWLRNKYASIVPRGPDVLSIRSLPTIGNYVGRTIAYRIHVPQERVVWLKCGIEAKEFGWDSGQEPPASSRVLQKLLSEIGRYEQRLPPGEYVLSIASRKDVENHRIRVTLDSSVMIDSELQYPSSGAMGSSHTFMEQQHDYQDFLQPSLLTIDIEPPSGEMKDPSDWFRFQVGLSYESSDFPPFPGVQ